VEVNPKDRFPSPVTLIPTYPDLPMEDVYPRVPASDVRELYLKEVGKGRVAYFPGDVDRSFWQIMNADHGHLLRNTIRWALNEAPIIEVEGAGILDTTVWRQKASMTVHLVNLTNPMMMKGPCREIIPLSEQQVTIQLPEGTEIAGLQLLMSEENPDYTVEDGRVKLTVPKILDHEIVAVDFKV
jgi:hypothetical protein